MAIKKKASSRRSYHPVMIYWMAFIDPWMIYNSFLRRKVWGIAAGSATKGNRRVNSRDFIVRWWTIKQVLKYIRTQWQIRIVCRRVLYWYNVISNTVIKATRIFIWKYNDMIVRSLLVSFICIRVHMYRQYKDGIHVAASIHLYVGNSWSKSFLKVVWDTFW